MTEIVLVHGVAQQQKAAALLAAALIPALAGGIENARDQLPQDARQLADTLVSRIKSGVVTVVPAFYGALFLEPRLETNDEKEFADSFAAAWLKAASERDLNGRVGRAATHAADELRQIHAVGQAQGAGHLLGQAIQAFSKVPGLGKVLIGGATKLVPTLAQVTKYMLDQAVQQTIRDSVRRLITPDTRVLIGHSLGSIVAYDVARTMDQHLPLLLTLGSPLGLHTVVYEKLNPQPPAFPERVGRWVNIADREDYIASTSDLRPLFSTGKPAHARFDNVASVNNGDEPHALDRYLTKPETGLALLEALIPLL